MNENDADISAKLHDLDLLWNTADVPASEAAFNALLPIAQRLMGRDRSQLIELVCLIARSRAIQGNFSGARQSLGQADHFLEEQESLYEVSAKIRYLIEKGRLHILEKTPSQAKVLFAEAWNLAVNSDEDYFSIEIAQLMATIEPIKNQQRWIVQAIEIAEQSSIAKAKRWLGALYTSMAWRHYEMHQYEKSLGLFEKALGHLKAQGAVRESFIAQWSIGKVLRTLGRTEEAFEIQKKLLSELGIGGRRDGRLYEELAECLQTLNRSTEAQLYFELAYREFSSDEWITDNQPLKLKRMKDLGKVK
jgi:tetratricopeptide (TPR) repeat protein